MRRIVGSVIFSVAICFILLNSLEITSSEKSKAKDLYIKQCSKCHRKDGTGIKGVYPPLKNADYVKNNTTQELLRGMIFGRSGKIVVNGSSYNGIMTTELDKNLSDDAVADILNYVFTDLNFLPRSSTAKDVKAARKAGKL